MNQYGHNFTKTIQRIDAAHHMHPFTDHKSLNAVGSRVIVSAEGCWLTDSDGNRILDGMAGLWCMQVGYGRQSITDAVAKQLAELPYYNTFFKTTHVPAARLAEKLAEVTPAHMNRAFFVNSGSEANDTVFRMVRYYWDLMGKPDKKIIIGRNNAYHGSTVAGTSLGGMGAMHKQGDLPVPGVHHIMQPYWFGEGGDLSPAEFGIKAARALDEAIEQLGEDRIAAFIAEPIQGAGGVIIPPETYWPEIKKVLAKRDILLVVDEVICKGGEFYHGFTYSGHPAACAAALENIRILQEEAIVDKVRDETAPYLQEGWLSLADHPLVGEARMVGMVGALELVPEKGNRARKFPSVGEVGTLTRDMSFRNGLVMRAVRDSLILSPPLVISKSEIDELVARARKTLDDSHAELSKRGLLA